MSNSRNANSHGFLYRAASAAVLPAIAGAFLIAAGALGFDAYETIEEPAATHSQRIDQSSDVIGDMAAGGVCLGLSSVFGIFALVRSAIKDREERLDDERPAQVNNDRLIV